MNIHKKTCFLIIIALFIIGTNFVLVPTKADEDYFLNTGHFIDKSFSGKEGYHCSYRYTLEPYGTIRVFVFNDSAYKNPGLLSERGYLYNWNCGCDSGGECKGGFDIPYESTWHVCFLNSALPTTLILTKWEITKTSNETSIGINIIPFLLGFMCIGVIIMYKRSRKLTIG